MQTPIDIRIINPTSWRGWDKQVASLHEATPFHSAAWAKVLSETYGFEPSYYTGWQNGKLAIVIPMMKVASRLTGRRYVSLPFSDWCDPICESGIDINPVIERILADARSNGCKYVEWRCRQELFWNEPVWSTFFGHRLALAGGEAKVFSSFCSSTRRNIRKAEKEKVQIRWGDDLGSMREFYRLHCRTRREHSLPPQPFSFFRNIWEYVIRPKHGLIILASHLGKDIAASLSLHFSRHASYKFGASDSRYQELRANNLVMWEAIKWYCRESYKDFDFGRTDMTNEGLRRYKLGWGAEESPICYYRYDTKQDRFIVGSQSGPPVCRFIRKMPIFLLRRIGELSYRHFA